VRGWRHEIDVHVMTAELGPVLRSSPDADTDVHVDDSPDDDWLALYRSQSGPLPDAGPREILVNHPTAGFASVRDDAGCQAIARATVDGRWAGLFAVEVSTARRGRGLGKAVSVGALRGAARPGAPRPNQQVAQGNTNPHALDEALGLSIHHE
jgi:hypothetical protein